MFFELPRFSYSLKEIHTKVKKVYVIDNGFIKATGFLSTPDIGKLYENVVFNELRRREKEIYYYKDKRGREIDFIVKKENKISQCIQVSFNVENETTFQREIDSLIAGMKTLKIKNGQILTDNREDEIEIKGNKITFVPVWK